MRLDKYLKLSRLIKRRSVADDACCAGKIFVNGKSAKSAYNVKVGDEITIRLGQTHVNVIVLSIKVPAGKEEAALMYRLIK